MSVIVPGTRPYGIRDIFELLRMTAAEGLRVAVAERGGKPAVQAVPSAAASR